MQWLYVTGPARSGTTLVEHLFNYHPRCLITHEHRSLTDMVRHLDGLSLPPETTEGGAAYSGSDPVLIESEKFYAGRKNPPIGHLGGFDEITRKLFGSPRKPDLQVIGNKWPLHLGWNEDLEVFERLQVRIVAVVRNPCHTVASSMRRRNLAAEGFDAWNTKTLEQALAEVAFGFETTLKLVKRFPDRTLVFRYEDLLAHPTDVMAAAFGLVGLGPLYLDEVVDHPNPDLDPLQFLTEEERARLYCYFPTLMSDWSTMALPQALGSSAARIRLLLEEGLSGVFAAGNERLAAR